MGSKCNCRILVAEIEPQTLEDVVRNLIATGCGVITASNGEEAVEKARLFGPELLVIDSDLPSLRGTSVIRALKADPRTSGIGVITLTAPGDDVDRIVSLELGADDCISKPVNPRELTLRARSLVDRRAATQLPHSRWMAGSIEMDDVVHEVKVNGRRVELTPIEYRMLRVLFRHPGRVFSRTEILNTVWGSNITVGRRAVDTHLRRLRVKLGSASSQIETVRCFGYRLGGAT